MSISYVQRRFASTALRKWAYNLSGFNKYGLWRDDLRSDLVDEVVQEALKRVPQEQVDARNFRIIRAAQLNIQKDILPKEQWTKYEEDEMYLTPHIEAILKERAEQAEWNKNH